MDGGEGGEEGEGEISPMCESIGHWLFGAAAQKALRLLENAPLVTRPILRWRISSDHQKDYLVKIWAATAVHLRSKN